MTTIFPPILSQLQSIAKLSEEEIANTLHECKDYVDFCKEYLSKNSDSLPKSLAEAYDTEIQAALSKFARAASLFPAEVSLNQQARGNYTYSAIVCLYKRSSLDDVLQSLSRQTIAPKSVMILINGNHIDPNEIRKRYPDVLVSQSDINSLYTRWCMGYMLDGDYIFVSDDDQVPGDRYIERALKLSSEKRALVCGTGRRYTSEGKQGFYEIVSPYDKNGYASNTLNVMPVECDWGCNSYLFKKEWIHFILAEKRFKNHQLKVDDIQLAYNLYAYGGISCWVAQQSANDATTLHSFNTARGDDEHALWRKSDHFHLRKDYLAYLVNNGLFKPYYARMSPNESI